MTKRKRSRGGSCGKRRKRRGGSFWSDINANRTINGNTTLPHIPHGPTYDRYFAEKFRPVKNGAGRRRGGGVWDWFKDKLTHPISTIVGLAPIPFSGTASSFIRNIGGRRRGRRGGAMYPMAHTLPYRSPGFVKF